MAEVWEGHDEVLTRQVAVKVLQAHLAEDGIFLERFRREAVTAARLAHPGVVATFDTGVDDGTAYIVMELVRGPTLRQLLTEQGPSSPGWRLPSPDKSPTPWPTPTRPDWCTGTSSRPTCC